MTEIEKNKILVKKYPFLMPHNVFTDEIDKDYDYSYTYLDWMPNGWKKAFGELLCEDIMQELVKNDMVETYRVEEVKEKFGELRWYDNCDDKAVQLIIEKYTTISRHVCLYCGKLDAHFFNDGWLYPSCFDCYRKNYKVGDKTPEQMEQYLNSLDTSHDKWDNKLVLVRYLPGVDNAVRNEYDCSDIIKRIINNFT